MNSNQVIREYSGRRIKESRECKDACVAKMRDWDRERVKFARLVCKYGIFAGVWRGLRCMCGGHVYADCATLSITVVHGDGLREGVAKVYCERCDRVALKPMMMRVLWDGRIVVHMMGMSIRVWCVKSMQE